MTRALVVGSGPNGLAAAIALAQEGIEVTVAEAASTIGGGTRTEALTLPGLLHDVCSAAHPFAAASPFLRTLPLDEHGLAWASTNVEVAHPIAPGRVGVLHRSIDETANGLGSDAARWRRVFGPMVKNFDKVTADALTPVSRLPRHPVAFGSFGLRALLSGTAAAKLFRTEEAKALVAGNSAHAMRKLSQPLTFSVGALLTAAGHAVGWPVAIGGSAAITTAMASMLEGLGGTIETGWLVTSENEIRDFDIVMFDIAPRAIAKLGRDVLPDSVHQALSKWKYGPGAFKVDLAIEGHLPWTDEVCGRAGTVHLGGTAAEVADVERQVALGKMPDRPFVLVGQQYLADPSRSSAEANPIWAYAHVPAGYDGDATEAIFGQIERFAPGFRDQVLMSHVASPADLESYNANYIGGDILTGANSMQQMLLRPRPGLNPYGLGVPGWAVCSAATPPGAGVHGMCGALAAQAVLANPESYN